MFTRLVLLLLAALCVFMNVLVWRAEYSSRAEDFPVPESLVWRKIMTAPEASNLNVYQTGKRTGFCEFSTSVEQEMAQLDENRPPPEGFASHGGYQLHISGNASIGDFTNRVKFDGHVQFALDRSWRSLDLHLNMRGLTIALTSSVTNQNVKVYVLSDGVSLQRTLTFTELTDPNQILRSFADDLGGDFGEFVTGLELPGLATANSPGVEGGIHWQATRSRMQFGSEAIPVFRLETRVLDRPIVIIASTLGEILRVEIPGDTVATWDEWTKE